MRDPQRAGGGRAADVDGQFDGGDPAAQAEVEGGGRQRVDREQQGERVVVAAVGEAEPAAHLAEAPGRPTAQPAVAGSRRRSRRSRMLVLPSTTAPPPGGVAGAEAFLVGGMRGGLAVVRTSSGRAARSPKNR